MKRASRNQNPGRRSFLQKAIAGASATVMLMLLDVSTKGIVATGMYNDTLVKTANGWRFKSRATKMDTAAPAPAAAPATPPKQ